MNTQEFIEAILDRYSASGRSLPWRETTDVYKIAVSEFMLQQTQVSRVIEKYTTFLARFPSAEALASASQRDVLEMWQGLGYNRRALWLQGLAEFLVEHPNPSLDELRSVKGVGAYTAAAILSFSSNAEVAAIDVNVHRIFNRYFGQASDDFITQTVPSGNSRDWHNALMDFGSMVCTKENQLVRVVHCVQRVMHIKTTHSLRRRKPLRRNLLDLFVGIEDKFSKRSYKNLEQKNNSGIS